MKKTPINTTQAPAVVGPYSQATVFDNLVFTSGQIPLHHETGAIVGEDVHAQTHQVFRNLRAVLEAAGASLDTVIKTTCFLASMDDCTSFNEIYAQYFTNNFPSRSCVAVKTLPKHVLVEVEVVAYITK